jgi:hypothetical protein
MFLLHPQYLVVYLIHFGTSSLNCCRPVTLPLPTMHISLHFVVPAPFLLYVVTQFTYVRFISCVIHEFQATRLPHSIFFVALLTKMAPSPVATIPASLFEVAHGYEQSAASARWAEVRWSSFQCPVPPRPRLSASYLSMEPTRLSRDAHHHFSPPPILGLDKQRWSQLTIVLGLYQSDTRCPQD